MTSKTIDFSPEKPGRKKNPDKLLRLASFNIQSGIRTSRYHHYLTKSWQHVLPTPWRKANLSAIASQLSHFDIVGLQEVDGGSLRSDYVIQTEFLARRAGFDHWYNQVNRRIGNMALHSNGLLSRIEATDITLHKLPGLPGRGLLMAQFGSEYDDLCVLTVHLALGKRARIRQIDYISALIRELPRVAVLGDFNCEPESEEMRRLLDNSHLHDPAASLMTFPSWQPKRKLDYILVSDSLQLDNIQVLDFACSDHLPISLDLRLGNRQAVAA